MGSGRERRATDCCVSGVSNILGSDVRLRYTRVDWFSLTSSVETMDSIGAGDVPLG